MRHERFFRFKKFSVLHERSAMKVGVDGVLIGAWAGGSRLLPLSILDVGAGCGLISLICAQRFADSTVLAVDVDMPSVEEAALNFANSPWSARLESRHADFMKVRAQDCPDGFDLIISNPPFFDAGINPRNAGPRLRARHADTLSPLSLIARAADLLSDRGVLAFICPCDWQSAIEAEVARSGLHTHRLCQVYGSAKAPPKRLLVEIGRVRPAALETSELRIHKPDGDYTSDYRSLTSPFYLNF